MKKIFLVAVLALFTSSAFAQLLTSSRVARSERAHNVWIDLGVGTYTSSGASGTDLNLGIRVNKMFHEYVGWDIIKVGAHANTKDFGKTISVEALTGIRGESPVLFANAKAYANFALGYIHTIDPNKGAFEWEIGAGLKITPRINVGVAFDSSKRDGVSSGVFGLRLGFAL